MKIKQTKISHPAYVIAKSSASTRPLGYGSQGPEAPGRFALQTLRCGNRCCSARGPGSVTHGPVLQELAAPTPLRLCPWPGWPRWPCCHGVCRESWANSLGGQSTLLGSGQQQRATAHLAEGALGKNRGGPFPGEKQHRGTGTASLQGDHACPWVSV